ncbi:glycosyltransferase [Sphingomonas mollis]|uniref:Glycosyltransferase n=1 Tax=Sphingomonas mollis TaxID=2795726 RepID=A0ABS0XNU1_9SPHN|nr:glycosyltransferase [Sphingomonas sp. BT553]MBJ6121707.1 glycosyltransferase [Sphingomonas sp. BT553]
MLLGTGLSGRTGDVPTIDLPDDRMPDDAFDGRDCSTSRPEALHYAPTDHDGIRRRIATVAGWIADACPALMIVDVSAEIAMLSRLASVPTVPVRLNGLRDDAPHRQMFAAADAILAPFHHELDDRGVTADVRAKTVYAPGLTPPPVVTGTNDRQVLVVIGRGGGTSNGEQWIAAARAVPDREWRVIGPCTITKDIPSNLSFSGWIDDPSAAIAAAGVIVGAAGDGIVSAVLQSGKPFVCIPEDRPFDEQRSKARGLAASAAAVVCPSIPEPDAWAQLIGQAEALDPAARTRLHDPHGPRHLADRLLQLADGHNSDGQRSA